MNDTLSLFHDPRVLAGMIQTGLHMMQPPVNGQTQMGHIGEALSQGMAAAGRVDTLNQERTMREMQLQMQQQRLEQGQSAFGLQQEQGRAAIEADKARTEEAKQLLQPRVELLRAQVGTQEASAGVKKAQEKAWQEGKLPTMPGGLPGAFYGDMSGQLGPLGAVEKLAAAQHAPELEMRQKELEVKREEDKRKTEEGRVTKFELEKLKAVQAVRNRLLDEMKDTLFWGRLSQEEKDAKMAEYRAQEDTAVARVEEAHRRTQESSADQSFKTEEEARAAAKKLANSTGKRVYLEPKNGRWVIGVGEK